MDIGIELQRWNIEIHEEKENTLLVRCPLPDHEDEHPSCIVNLHEDDSKPGFFCPVCHKGGTWFKLLALSTKTSEAAFKSLYERGGKHVNPKSIESWNADLCKSGRVTSASNKAKRELFNRGLSEDILNRYWVGWDNDKKSIMIPIPWGDRFVNVRRYRPGGKPKFSHYAKGYGTKPVLFPQDQLQYSKIVICGGEVKALAVAERMNQFGIGAVSSCSGENNWSTAQSIWFIDKKVWVCYDIDGTGVEGANKVCSLVSSQASWVGRVELPLPVELYPSGDVNDYFVSLEATPEDFLQLLEDTDEWIGESLSEDIINDEMREVSLKDLSGFNKPFNFKTSAYISGIDDSVAHKMPKEMHVKCSGDADVCALCKLQRMGNYVPSEGYQAQIDGRDPRTLQLIGVDRNKQREGWKEFFGIPLKCHNYTFTPSEELLTVRYALLSDTDADTDNPIPTNIVTSGEELHYGDVCYIEGRADKSPINTEEVRLITKHKPRDILNEYTLSSEVDLEIFKPAEDSYGGIDSKLRSIYHDMERNVTFIYDRMDMHILFDLAFHSPLWIPYANAIEPGWVSVLIVSETAQGKSTIMRRLLNHYGYGAYIDAANTTIAGLIGGVKTVGKRQFLKWGVLPQNDKRLVCIEEYANAPVELLRAMRAARDSGVVKLDKIDKGAAKARTRTIVLSNPKRIIPPGAVIDGVSLLEDLVNRPEDLRRFDIGMWATKLEVDDWHESNPPIYSSQACHDLITWAWTIPPDKIVFTPDAVNRISHSELPNKFPYLYLIGGREFEVKLARLSAALAVRLFSHADGKLIVSHHHVEWIEQFLDRIYSDPDFGYNSRISIAASMDEECNADALATVFKGVTNPYVMVTYCSNYNRYRTEDLKAAVGDSFTYDQVFNQLLIMGCIVPEADTRWNNIYLPTKRFKRLLPKMMEVFKGYQQPPDFM